MRSAPIDVVGHLMHAELTDWIPRVRIILATQDQEAFEPFDRFGFQHLIKGKSVTEILDEFTRLRRESLAALETMAIQEDQLDLPGLHPAFGCVTLRNLLATWVVHDLGHIAQVVKTMALEYRDAAGLGRLIQPSCMTEPQRLKWGDTVMTDTVMVFTGETFDELRLRGWSGNWVAGLTRVQSMTWFVATRSDGRTNRRAGHRHRSGFFLGRVSGAIPAPLPEVRRITIYFDRFAVIDVPEAWVRIRNPVAYIALEDLGIETEKLEWDRGGAELSRSCGWVRLPSAAGRSNCGGI